MLAALVAAPTTAVADPPPGGISFGTQNGGGATSGGGGIHVSAGLHGGGGGSRSYPNCQWQRAWTGSGASQRLAGTGFFPGLIALIRQFSPHNTTGRPTTVEVGPAAQADKDGNGEIDPEFTVPLLGDPDGDVIGEVTNITSFNELVLNIIGPQDVGEFVPDANGATPLDQLSADQKSGAQFKNNSRYPLIQRGTDPFTAEPLWWDPWFVAPEDRTGSCPAGLVYSPRTTNPRILLPDLMDFVVRRLPPVQPVIRPLDRIHGWAYVQVPTDFAVSAASLAPQSATASVAYIGGPGPSIEVWSQIEAMPTQLIFDPGDGSSPVVCALSQMRFNATNPGACSYVYLDSSATRAGGRFAASISVAWVARYSDSAGTVRFIDLAPRTATFGVQVAEARPVGQAPSR